MRIVSIDYSLTSPAICILSEDCKFENSNHYYLTNTKKFEGNFKYNIKGFPHLPYKNHMERYMNIAQWAMSCLPTDDDFVVYMEDYALAAKGQTFNIAENTAILKYFLHINSIEVTTIPPTTIKKFAIKGNASKELMYEAFQGLCGINLMDMFEVRGKLSNPITDIIDAYYIGLYGYECRKNSGKWS